MLPSEVYAWQIGLVDGSVHDQYNEDGSENTWIHLPKEQVVRVSVVPRLFLLPQHDIFIDLDGGNAFLGRFGRGFMRQGQDSFELKEYLQCIKTKHFRYYVLSTGRALVSPPDYELYL